MLVLYDEFVTAMPLVMVHLLDKATYCDDRLVSFYKQPFVIFVVFYFVLVWTFSLNALECHPGS